ncbi:MAG: glycosyltransferase [Solirubrobacterales bacterium]|nr:glycosyltransferase [Solirubrobacterales bacterium]
MTSEMEGALPMSVRGRNHVLPHGVDRSLFRPFPQSTARQQLGWSPDERVVLFVGEDPNKRCDLATEAVEIARSEFPALRLAPCTHVPHREVPVWMNAADILVLTSNVEGSPNVVKEAMACNLPIVSVDVGDVRNVVEGTRNCRIMAQDPKALAEGFCDVLRAVPARSDGRSRTDYLGLDAIAARLLEIYRSTADGAPTNATAAR